MGPSDKSAQKEIRWSCCYCGKSSINFQDANNCEQVHLEEFNQLPSSVARSICRCLNGRAFPMEATIEILWSFLGNHFCPGEQVNVEVSGVKYPAVVVSVEWPQYEVSLVVGKGEHQMLICPAEALSRSARTNWTKRTVRIFLRIVMQPKHEANVAFELKPEYNHFLKKEAKGSSLEAFVQDMNEYISREFERAAKAKSQEKAQQRLDSFFPAKDNVFVHIDTVKMIPKLKLPEYNKETNSWSPLLVNEFLFIWNFVVTFGGVELNIFPFRLQEFEAALKDQATQDKAAMLRSEPSLPITNEILYTCHKKLLRSLARARQECGKDGLQQIFANIWPLVSEQKIDLNNIVVEENSWFASCLQSRELHWPTGDAEEKKQKLRWYFDKFDNTNWVSMLIGFLFEILPEEIPKQIGPLLNYLACNPYDYPLLSVEQKLFILRLLVEMVLTLPICRIAIDSFTEKVHEAKKNKRAAEHEHRTLKKELDTLQRTEPSPDRPAQLKLGKESKAIQNKLEYQERMIKHAENEICKWNCVRVSPLGTDRDNRSYWIFDYWGPNVEAGDCGRLYVKEGDSFCYFYDTIEHLDALIFSLKDPYGSNEKSLLKELSETYYEHLCNSMRKYYTPQAISDSSQVLSDDYMSDTKPDSQEPKRVGRRKATIIDPNVTFLRYQNRWDKHN